MDIDENIYQISTHERPNILLIDDQWHDYCEYFVEKLLP